MKIFYLLMSIIFASCSTTGQVDLSPSGDNVYISNGVEQYFLPQLPHWANFSYEGKCFRKDAVRYVNFEKMYQSYNLNYFQLINMQHMFNRKLYAYKSSLGQDQLSPKDESFVFHTTYQKIIGGGSDFIVPKYKRLSLIMVDDIMHLNNKLKRILRNKNVQKGYPILVSRCYSSYELEEMIQKLGLEAEGLKFISAEMFSTYNKDLQKRPEYNIDFKAFFKDKQMTIFKTKVEKSKNGQDITIKEI